VSQIVALNYRELLTHRPCPLCGVIASQPLFETIRRCSGCGLAFVSPLGEFRGEHESPEYFLNEYLPLQLANWDNSVKERRAHLDMIRRHSVLPLRPRLLDVGCALGLMLQQAKMAGWEASGVETSAFAADYAQQHTGCPVFAGTLQQARFAARSFNVVTVMDVIEHVAEPQVLVGEVYRLLVPQGVMFVVTPNFGSFFARLYGANAYGIGPQEHVNYFVPSTLWRLLRQAGFSKIVIGTKDLYAANLRRLMGKRQSKCDSDIKSAFGRHRSLESIRWLANKLFMHVKLGDKLVALAQK
jgi:2-polyprenyl-3-methyl-5-hydroxy-6-metoxy-1,4-benzoquinol methylase